MVGARFALAEIDPFLQDDPVDKKSPASDPLLRPPYFATGLVSPLAWTASIPIRIDRNVPLTRARLKDEPGDPEVPVDVLFWELFGEIHVHPDRAAAFCEAHGMRPWW